MPAVRGPPAQRRAATPVPPEWERWWLGTARKAIAADYLTHHGRGTPTTEPAWYTHPAGAGCRPASAGNQHFNPQRPRGLLEPCAWRRARTVLRGPGAATRPGYPTRRSAPRTHGQAGDLVQPGGGRKLRSGACAARPASGRRSRCRPRSMPQDAGTDARCAVTRPARLRDLLIEEVNGAQQDAAPWPRAQGRTASRTGPRRAREASGSHFPLAQGGEGARVALPADHRLDDRAGGLVPGQLRHHGRQLAQGVLQQLLKPLPVPGPVPRSGHRCGGHGTRSARISGGGTNGPQHPHLGQPRDPPGVLLVRLGPSRQVPGLGGAHQLHGSPASSGTKTRCASSRRWLHRHHLHPGPFQLRPERHDRGDRGRHLLQVRRAVLFPSPGGIRTHTAAESFATSIPATTS